MRAVVVALAAGSILAVSAGFERPGDRTPVAAGKPAAGAVAGTGADAAGHAVAAPSGGQDLRWCIWGVRLSAIGHVVGSGVLEVGGDLIAYFSCR